jgi:hypothetical protein
MQTLPPTKSSAMHCSPGGHGLLSEQLNGTSFLAQPVLYGSPVVPPGHWQEKLPGSFLHTAPSWHGLPAHSSISTHPRLVPVYPVLQIHLASWLTSMHCSLGPQALASHGSANFNCKKPHWTSFCYSRLQSSPMLGSGHKHLFLWSQIALPGQSGSDLQVTISLHLVRGSGLGTLPSGHLQVYEPGEFSQMAPIPQEFDFEHSSMSTH